MNGFKAILILAFVLCLSVVAASGVAYGQSFMVGQSGNMAFPYLDGQDNALNNAPASTAHADMNAPGQSIIFKDGVPTTVIGSDGSSTPYSASMWDFLAGYNIGCPYGVGISSNPDVPIGGTWMQVTESGTLGTQEPNLSLG
jgi:hypothetical protein